MQTLQILLHTAHTAVDAHIIIVEDNQQIIGRIRCIVESFKGQAATHRSIAGHTHDMAVFLAFFESCNGHTECRRDGIARMAASKGVIRAFFG